MYTLLESIVSLPRFCVLCVEACVRLAGTPTAFVTCVPLDRLLLLDENCKVARGAEVEAAGGFTDTHVAEVAGVGLPDEPYIYVERVVLGCLDSVDCKRGRLFGAEEMFLIP